MSWVSTHLSTSWTERPAKIGGGFVLPENSRVTTYRDKDTSAAKQPKPVPMATLRQKYDKRHPQYNAKKSPLAPRLLPTAHLHLHDDDVTACNNDDSTMDASANTSNDVTSTPYVLHHVVQTDILESLGTQDDEHQRQAALRLERRARARDPGLWSLPANIDSIVRDARKRSRQQTRKDPPWLPVELWIEVTHHLSLRDVLSCAQVCHDWRQLFAGDDIWRALYLSRFTNVDESRLLAFEAFIRPRRARWISIFADQYVRYAPGNTFRYSPNLCFRDLDQHVLPRVQVTSPDNDENAWRVDRVLSGTTYLEPEIETTLDESGKQNTNVFVAVTLVSRRRRAAGTTESEGGEREHAYLVVRTVDQDLGNNRFDYQTIPAEAPEVLATMSDMERRDAVSSRIQKLVRGMIPGMKELLRIATYCSEEYNIDCRDHSHWSKGRDELRDMSHEYHLRGHLWKRRTAPAPSQGLVDGSSGSPKQSPTTRARRAGALTRQSTSDLGGRFTGGIVASRVHGGAAGGGKGSGQDRKADLRRAGWILRRSGIPSLEQPHNVTAKNPLLEYQRKEYERRNRFNMPDPSPGPIERWTTND